MDWPTIGLLVAVGVNLLGVLSSGVLMRRARRRLDELLELNERVRANAAEGKAMWEDARGMRAVMLAETRALAEARLSADQAAYQIWGALETDMQPAQFIAVASPILAEFGRARRRQGHLELVAELERITRNAQFEIGDMNEGARRYARRHPEVVIADTAKQFALTMIQSVRTPQLPEGDEP